MPYIRKFLVSQAPWLLHCRLSAQEQKAKSQGPPAAEAKPSVTAVTAIPNAVGLRTGALISGP